MIAYGLDCLWWDDASQAAVERVADGDRLRCPRCGGPCELYLDRESFLDLARRFEILGFVGHRTLLAWVRGRCYRTRGDAWAAYAARGATINPGHGADARLVASSARTPLRGSR